jgi:hypothetical protein
MSAKLDYEKFKVAFKAVCEQYGGTFNQDDTIGDGSSFRIPTCYGQLRVSIHALDGLKPLRGSGHFLGIYMQFRNYTGPVEIPIHGDWNRWSNKWNITFTGGNLESVRKAALEELEIRLDLLKHLAVTAAREALLARHDATLSQCAMSQLRQSVPQLA